MEKKLFFGFDLNVSWPLLPSKPVIEEKERHLTLLFLGNVSLDLQKINTCPTLPFTIGPVGIFDRCLFIPKRHPRLVAWEMALDKEPFISYQKELSSWLKDLGIEVSHRNDFLPHVTLARKGFSTKAWKEAFYPIPFAIGDFHLYESLGNSHYNSLWQIQVVKAYEEIPHTADIAFLIRGKTLKELFYHGEMALFSYFPNLLFLREDAKEYASLDEVIIALNEIVTKADIEEGAPVKAISFHGEALHKENYLEWEMIIDV